ncbi:MAG TPA: hypothetical protein VF766_14665 [Pyrinomonadaceae bacterium]
MQAAQITLKQYGRERTEGAAIGLTAQVSNWLTRVFGCWHSEMSRPFTHDGCTYRTCLECGARRNFDSSRWEMVGAYYYNTPKGQSPALTRNASAALNPSARVSLQSGASSRAYS